MPRALRSRGRVAYGEDDDDAKDETTSSNGSNPQRVTAWTDEDSVFVISGLSSQFLSSFPAGVSGQGGTKREEPADLERYESPRKRRRIEAESEVQADPEKLLRIMRQNSSVTRKSISEQGNDKDSKSFMSDESRKVEPGVVTPRQSQHDSMVLDEDTVSKTIEAKTKNSPQHQGDADSAASTPARGGSPNSTIPSPPQQSARASKSPSPPTDPNELTEADLPPAFLPRANSPPKQFSDKAAEILFEQFSPIPSPHQFIAALTRHAPADRSSATLFKLAENCQRALEAWQDEYIILDKKTAPLGNPPKKPATGGRVPVDPSALNVTKEAEARVAGALDVVLSGRGTRAASEAGRPQGPRELRRRRADASIVDGLGISEDDAGAERGKRARRPVRRFDAGSNGAMQDSTEPRRRGRGGRISALRGEVVPNRYTSPTPDTAGDTDTADDDDSVSRGQTRRTGRGGRGNGRNRVNTNTKNGNTSVPTAKNAGEKRKQRVKSEKRSESMTAWWAERKRKALAEKMNEMQKNGQIPDRTPNISGPAPVTNKPAVAEPPRSIGGSMLNDNNLYAKPEQSQSQYPPHPQTHLQYPRDDIHKTAMPRSPPPPLHLPHNQTPTRPQPMYTQGPPPPPPRYIAPSGPPISPSSHYPPLPPPPPPSYSHQQSPLRLSNLIYPDYPPPPPSNGVTAVPGPPPPSMHRPSHSHSHSHGHGHNYPPSHMHGHDMHGRPLPPPPMHQNPNYPPYSHGQHQIPYPRPQEQQR